MAATIEPPAPPKGQPINVADIPRRGHGATVSQGVIDAINAEASKAGGEPAEAAAPPSNPAPKPEAPPAANGKPPEAATAAVTPAPEQPKPKKDGIESVREALERQTAKLKDMEASNTTTSKQMSDALARAADLAAKVAKYEDDIEKDYKPRAARLEKAEKEIQRTQDILRVKDYTATDEWHQKYVKPMADTQADVSAFLAELEVNTDQGTRRATIEDFNKVLASPSHTAAIRISKEIFGDEVSQTLLNFRIRLQGHERARQEALKTAQLDSSEYETRQQTLQAQHRQSIHDRLVSETKRIMEENQDTFNIPEEDSELRTALNDGQMLADRLLNGDQNMTQEQFVTEIAKGRTNMMKAPVLEKKLAQARTKIATLEEQLKAYQKSEPDVRTRNGGAALNSGGETARDKLLAAAIAASQQPNG